MSTDVRGVRLVCSWVVDEGQIFNCCKEAATELAEGTVPLPCRRQGQVKCYTGAAVEPAADNSQSIHLVESTRCSRLCNDILE